MSCRLILSHSKAAVGTEKNNEAHRPIRRDFIELSGFWIMSLDVINDGVTNIQCCDIRPNFRTQTDAAL